MSRVYSPSIWNEGSPYDLAAFIKIQDKRFRRALIRAHPEFAPSTPKRIRIERSDLTSTARTRIGWRAVVDQVAAKHEVTFDDIVGRSRNYRNVAARNEAIHRLHFEEGRSYPWIGWRFSDRDHSTILHGASNHARLLIAEASATEVSEVFPAIHAQPGKREKQLLTCLPSEANRQM